MHDFNINVLKDLNKRLLDLDRIQSVRLLLQVMPIIVVTRNNGYLIDRHGNFSDTNN